MATRPWKAFGTHQEWARRAARSFYLASALWAQAERLERVVKPALIADKLAFLGVERQGGEAFGEQWRLPRHVFNCASAGRENTKWNRFANLQERRHPDQR